MPPPSDGHGRPSAGTAPAGPSRPRRLPWALASAGLLAFVAHAVFYETHGTPSTTGHETRPVGEVAGQVGIRQTFALAADGFDGLTVHVQPSGREHDGPIVFELAEAGDDPSGAADVPVYRAAVEARRVADGRTFTWRFAPVEGSAGKRYALRIAMPSAPFDHGVTLLATRDEHYADGQLWFDGREQWGDLVLATSARQATVAGGVRHAWRGAPAWVRSRVTLALVFAAYTLALLVAFGTIVDAGRARLDHEPALAPPAPVSPQSRRVLWLGVVLVGSLVLAAAHVLYQPRVAIERGARELLAEFPDVGKRTTMASVQQAFVYTDVSWRGRRMHCVTALPFARITWAVDAQPGTELRGWLGMRPDVWQGHGDGSTFRVGVNDAGRYVEHAKRRLHPDAHPSDRVFVPIRVDLSEYAGRRIEVVLNTEPEYNAVGDAALWCEVRVAPRE